MTAIRTKWMDPWFNRTPKTHHYCMLCQRDIKPDAKFMTAHWERDAWEAIHRDDLERARVEFADPIESGPIGMNCAKKFGMEWFTHG